MPYITKDKRQKLDSPIADIYDALSEFEDDPGALNYVISSILINWIDKPNYSKINSAIGILDCVKLELYRRLASKYEDQKIEENGDVY